MILGEKEFYSGITAQIQSSRVIIAIMTNEHFSEETVGNATASIKWDIVSPPERYFFYPPRINYIFDHT